MKIRKDNREEVKTALTAWAKANKAKVKETGDVLTIEKNGWMIEVLPEDGWAYLHGNGTLNGISTNVGDTDELGVAIKRLTGDK